MSETAIQVAAPRTAAPGKPFAVVGVFDTPAAIYHACETLRDSGYTAFDAHTPFPVHGLERAMGIPPSRMPWISLAGGIAGLLGMIALAYYTQGVWYPLNISGKAGFSYQAFVPLFFEVTVLIAGIATFVGLWVLNKQPMYFHPVMQHAKFPSATDDKFLISVETTDPKYDPAATRALLEELGATDIDEVAP